MRNGAVSCSPSDRRSLEEKDTTGRMGFGPSVTCRRGEKLEIVQRKAVGKFVGYRGPNQGAARAVPEDE